MDIMQQHYGDILSILCRFSYIAKDIVMGMLD